MTQTTTHAITGFDAPKLTQALVNLEQKLAAMQAALGNDAAAEAIVGTIRRAQQEQLLRQMTTEIPAGSEVEVIEIEDITIVRWGDHVATCAGTL